ncbi:Putative glycoside hydrolase [Streptomyces venezuelae]|uniref:glycoside hydrolase family 3 C-terminal domain-containing protein n=1 Tax=Streptomyces gardneri TaxID=66892 RepID=UPI0006BC6255|nr:glycoside hydrolase family 3 C-terminal domain-containing protein [Streptomyces gardneri]ALO12318.1 Putative glycoside hydrolase [Streptomyces venezuelae]QPK49117.1 glycoside hydrolase family 3 C-terminal domain-containing protein [Streptomyces gardneri]WRK40617.1 glycoside hydrolase family 3 C-terminal domain-containing protein [Streptomyces venezuelae]CUM37087.1 putative glycoside hydrolase [Streptomyces venezuelae]
MTAHRPPFRDPALPVARRVDDLLDRLTADERLALLHQFTPGVERLGLAAFRTGQEALHGVAWSGPATVFPQAVGLGASWHPELVRRVGEAVSRETRAMRAKDGRVGLNVWSPTVNLLRNPLWGRGEEGYAEDPTLTSAIATAFTRGLRGDHPLYWRTAPVLKHWLAHNNEAARDTSSASVRPRVLREYDLRAFRGAVEAGAVAGVMPAYNLVNGRPNHLSPYLEEELRSWTDQELLVCSDAGAPSNLADSQGYFATHEEAVAAALRAGVDSFTDHGTDASVILGRLRGALERGLIDAADVDRAVRRQLTVRCLLGEFDPELDPYADESRFDTPEHRELARKAAEAAVVLLKNESSPRGPLLPLAAGTRIAVVGLLADAAKLDWYSGSLLHRSTPLDGLRERFGRERVTFAEGVDRIRLRTASGTRLRVAESGLPGPDDVQDTVPDVDGSLDPALIAGRTDLPPLTADAEGSELALIDWGDGALTLRAPDGRYLSVAEDGFVRASADEPGGWVVQETFRLEALEAHDGGHLLLHLGTGGYVSVAADGVKVAADRESAEVFSVETVERGEEAVARAAAGADVVIVVAGNDPHVNGRETEDRTTLDLPAHQDRLWRAAHAANPRTALVLVSSYPYAVPEAAALLPALLWTAHGGQAAGTALARILAGDVSPAGRLPQTWYAADADLAGMLDYDVIGGRQTYLYFDGTPLFPFGHGLTYTTFGYEELTAAVDGETVHVSCTVTNTGPVASDEVVQVYARAVTPSVPRPHRELLAHDRVHVTPGASATLTFGVPLTSLGHWDVAHGRWTVEPGPYEIQAGASSGDIRRTVRIEVTGTPPTPRPVLVAGLAAADYDEQSDTVIVDRTKVRGDAVTPTSPDGPGTLVYRSCDFADGVTEVAVAVAGEGTLDLTLPDGTLLAHVEVPDTGGPYTYRTLSAPFVTQDVVDVHATLHGPLRLAHLTFTGWGSP